MRAWSTFCGGQLVQSGLEQHQRYVYYASLLAIADARTQSCCSWLR